MPVQECQKGGKSGHKWGSQGVCFVGSGSRAKAAEVGRAIHAQEKRMDRLQLLKSIVESDDLDTLFADLRKALHIPSEDKKKKKKDKVKKDNTGLLEQLRQLITKAEASPSYTEFSSSPMIGEQIAKSVDESRGLVTAIILRPDVVDLNGDIYDAVEVEKACFNFNTRCRQTNVQHEKMADFDMVESYIAKADFILGEGQVLKGDWLGTMYIDPLKHKKEWDMVKSGQFTGFSIGCKASVETI